MTASPDINLALIASRAEPDWADNWNFRAYLQQSVNPAEIDRVAMTLNTEVSGAIDCTQCGNCCREVYPFMLPADVSRLAEGLGESESALLSRMTPAEDGTVVFCQRPCPMLKEDKCTVYAHRPDDCREYPHLHKSDFLGGSIGVIENYGTCPIVFHVYNRMKTSFAYDASKDYIGDTDPEMTHGSSFGG